MIVQLLQIGLARAARSIRQVVFAWNDFWFEPADSTTLAAIRILTGLVLLYVHLSMLPQCLEVIGPRGWLDAQACRELCALDALSQRSLWTLVENPVAIVILHSLFVAAIACLVIGWQTRLSAVVVWLGQLSYVQRGMVLTYGLDSIAAFLTLYLMIGPCGRVWSIDAWLAARHRQRGRGWDAPVRNELSSAANLAIRCIQVHMCIVYLSAGLSKLHGSMWWSGVATYYAAMSPEMWPVEFDVSWMGRNLWLTHALANLSCWFTLAFEISFAFLIWNRSLRPPLLASAAILHLGIGASMGLGAFGFIMLAGCTAFVPAAELQTARNLLIRCGQLVRDRLCSRPAGSV